MTLLVANLSVSFPNTVFTVYIAANERFVFKQSVTILLNVLIPVLSLPILYMGKGSVGVVSVTLGLSVLRLALNMTYALKKLRMRFRFGAFDRALFSSLFAFSFFIFLSDVVDQMNTNVDKFLLGRMMGTGAVAIYSVAFELKTYYTFCSWVVPEMFIPEANRIAVEGADPDKMTEIFTRIGRYNNTILLLVLSGFILLGKPFIALWAGPGYENSYPATVILMLASYIPSIQTLGVTIQNARNMHRPRSVIYFLVACANVGISVLLIRRWGVTGTSLGTLFAILAGHGVFMNLYYHFRIGLNVIIFWKTILRWTIPVVGLCGISWLLIRNIPVRSWGMLLAMAAVYAVLYIGLLWFLGLRKEEKVWVRTKLVRMLHFLRHRH